MADPEIPRGGGTNPPGRGAPIHDFAKFPQKLHEIEKIWTPRAREGPPPPLDPPMVVTHCISFKQCLKRFKLCSHLQRYSPSCRRPQRSLNIPFTAYGHFSIEKEWYQSRLGSREVSGLLPPANEVWGKVIFSQACVIPSVRGVRRGSAHPPPLGRTPLDAAPLGRPPWMQTPPPQICQQQAGGTHRTGMHTC